MHGHHFYLISESFFVVNASNKNSAIDIERFLCIMSNLMNYCINLKLQNVVRLHIYIVIAHIFLHLLYDRLKLIGIHINLQYLHAAR